MCLCVLVCICIGMYVCMLVWCICVSRMYVNLYMDICVCEYVCMCVYVCLCVCMFVCLCVYMYRCVYVSVYVGLYVCFKLLNNKFEKSALSMHIFNDHITNFDVKLKNYELGIIKQVKPCMLDRSEDYFIFKTQSDLHGLNRYKVTK